MLLIRVLNMSLTASYCILAVLAVRWLLRRAPKKYAYLLWLVVAFRLCCPVSFNSPLSLFGLGIFDQEVAEGHTMAYLDEDVGLQQKPQLATGLAASSWQNMAGSQENGAAASQGRTESTASGQALRIPLPSPGDGGNSVNPLQVWGAVGSALWLAGMGVMLLCGLVSYLLLRRRLRCSVLLRDNIYQSERVGSPFILGFWRPHIYIPFGLEEGTLELVLAHERFHLRRRDHWIKLAAYLLLTLHWFNPLCWVAFLLMGKDMEMSCDEHVLAERQHSCKPYCNALLTFATGRHSWSPSPLAFGEAGAKGRIHNALKWKCPGVWVRTAAVCLCLVTVIACALNPQAADADAQSGQSMADSDGQNTADPSGQGEPEQVTDVSEPSQDSEQGAEWLLLRMSDGRESSATWDAAALRQARESQMPLELAEQDFYGVEELQLEVGWEDQELAVHIEYYENGAAPVLMEQRDVVLSKENGSYPLYLANPYEKLPEGGQSVSISFSHDGVDYLISGFIPRQGREQKELEASEPGTEVEFQGIIREFKNDTIVIDRKKLVNDGDELMLADLEYEDVYAPVSETCLVIILENHRYPERELSGEELPQYMAEEDFRYLLWNFTAEGNRITKIEEQYLP